MAGILLAPDAGPGVGAGHVDRMLALAEELGSTAGAVVLLPNEDKLTRRATERGVTLTTRGADVISGVLDAARRLRPNVVVLDGYGFNLSCQAELRDLCRLVVVDDLSQPCAADLVINPAPGAEALPPAPGAGRVLAGAQYAIMSRTYLRARQARSPRASDSGRVVVVSGMTDVGGILAEVVGAPELAAFTLDIAVGLDDVDLADRPRVTVHRSPPDLSGLLATAALYVGAAGTSAVQAAAVGVAAVVCPVVENQVRQANALEAFGAAVLVGRAAGGRGLARAAAALLGEPTRLHLLGSRGAQMVDGMGAERVASEVRNLAATTSRR